MSNQVRLGSKRTSKMDENMRSDVVRLCVQAHEEPDFENLFSYLPDDGLRVLATIEAMLVGHAVITTRWLQAGTKPLLRTAYVDAVATDPRQQGQGIGTAVMEHLATLATGWEIACLETERQPFYEGLGWEEWRGPAGGSHGCGTHTDTRPNRDHGFASIRHTTTRPPRASISRGKSENLVTHNRQGGWVWVR